jgi:hypothetical protein
VIRVSPCSCEHPNTVESAVERGSHKRRAAVSVDGIDVCTEIYEVLDNLWVPEVCLPAPLVSQQHTSPALPRPGSPLHLAGPHAKATYRLIERGESNLVFLRRLQVSARLKKQEHVARIAVGCLTDERLRRWQAVSRYACQRWRVYVLARPAVLTVSDISFLSSSLSMTRPTALHVSSASLLRSSPVVNRISLRT